VAFAAMTEWREMRPTNTITASDSAAAPCAAALAGLVAVAVGVGRFVYTPILPLMAEALGLSTFTAGLLASANFAGYLAGALFAVCPLPGSRRAWLVGALMASALTTGAMGLTQAVPIFLALRFVGGAASALGLILASAIVLEALAKAGRLDLSTVLFAGVGVGIVASAVLVSALQAEGFGWAALWIASSALSLAGVLAVAVLMPAGRPVAPARSSGPVVVARLPLIRLVAAYGLFGFGYVITATFLVAIVRADPRLRALEPSIWAVFGLAAAPSVALWTRLARRLGLAGSFALACLVEAAGVLTTVVWQTTAGIFLAAALVGGTFMGLTALGLVRGRSLAGGDSGRALALMTSAFGLGQIVGPSFAGWVARAFGSFAVPSMAAAGALVLAAVLGGAGRGLRKAGVATTYRHGTADRAGRTGRARDG
jgi:predicted MFS family arabinose efflux permease